MPRAEQGYGRIHRRFHDFSDRCSVFDRKCGQLPQTAQQDHGQGRGQRRQLRAPEPGTGAEVDQQAGQQLQPAALDRSSGRTQRRQLTDPAQRDGRARLDVTDIGLDRLPDLCVPIGVGIDRRRDLRAQFLDVDGQQLEKALFLAREVVVEGAFGRARATDDVGDGAGAIAAFGDRRGQAVEEPEAERIDLVESGSPSVAVIAEVTARTPFGSKRTLSALVLQSTVLGKVRGTSRYQLRPGRWSNDAMSELATVPPATVHLPPRSEARSWCRASVLPCRGG